VSEAGAVEALDSHLKNDTITMVRKPYRVIVHLHVFIDVAFRPEDRELTIETLDYLDILREMVQACLLPGATRSSW
jgi:predicted metalloprotease